MDANKSWLEKSGEEKRRNDNSSKEETNLLSNLNEYKYFSSKYLRQLLKQRIGCNLNIEQNSERIFGCLLFADISGFTQLSSRLSAEELKKHINEYFSLLLGVIHCNYGDVVKFCGDAVMILWPVPTDASHEMKAASVLLASLCGLQLLEECGDYKKIDSKSGSSIELSLHCGIACGELHCMILGNGHRSEFIVTGDTLKAMGQAESAAKKGEVCIAASAHEFIRYSLETQLVDSDASSYKGPVHRLTGKISSLFLQCMEAKQSPTNLEGTALGTDGLQPDSVVAAMESTDFESTVIKQRKSDVAVTSTVGDDLWSFFTKTTASGTKGNADNNRDNSVQSTDDVSREDSDHEPRCSTANNNRRRRGSISLLLAGLSPTRNSQEAPGSPISSSLTSSSASIKTRHRMSTTLFPVRSAEQQQQSSDARNSEKTGAIERSSLRVSSTEAAGVGTKGEDKLIQQAARNSRIRRSYGTRYLKHKLKISSDPGVLALTRLIVHGLQAADSNTAVEKTLTSREAKQKNLQLSIALRKFIHETALSAIDTHTSALLSEMRVITTLFIEIEGLEEDFAAGNITRPHKTFVIILSVMQKFGGSLRQFVVDDKGCVCIVCFGVFGSSKENNSRQAIEFAQLLQASLPSVGVSTFIGITTGKVYCGIVGAGHRCEFAVMGSSVNLAARLMCACKKVGARVLVDNVVYQNAMDYFGFQQFDKITAKGYSQPVAIFQPVGKRKTTILAPIDSAGTMSLGNATADSSNTQCSSGCSGNEEFPSRMIANGDKNKLLERDSELEKVVSALATTVDDATTAARATTGSRSVIVYGASGIGLTSFLSMVEEAALERGSADMQLVSVQCSTHLEYSSYSICGKILTKLMGAEEAVRPLDDVVSNSVKKPNLKFESSLGHGGVTARPHRLSGGVAHRRSSCKTLESTALAAIIEQPCESLEGHRSSNASTLPEPQQRTSNASKTQRAQNSAAELRILRWLQDHVDSSVSLGQAFLHCVGTSMMEYFSHVGTHDALDADTVYGLHSISLRDAMVILNDVLKTSFVSDTAALEQLLSSSTSDVIMDLFVDVMLQSLLSIALGDFDNRCCSSSSGSPASKVGSALILIDDVHLCDIESLNIVTKLVVKLHKSSSVEVGGFVLTCNENENRLGILESNTKRSSHQSKLTLAASIRRGISHRSLQLNLQLALLSDASITLPLPRLQVSTVKLIVKEYLGFRQWAWLMNNYKKAIGFVESDNGAANITNNPTVRRRSLIVSSTTHQKSGTDLSSAAGESGKHRRGSAGSAGSIASSSNGRRSSSFAVVQQLMSTPITATIDKTKILSALALTVQHSAAHKAKVVNREELVVEILFDLCQEGLPSAILPLAESLSVSIAAGSFCGLHQLPVVKQRLQLALEVIDTLDGTELATLKAASIVGNTFKLSELSAVLLGMGLTKCSQTSSLEFTLTRLIDVGLIHAMRVSESSVAQLRTAKLGIGATGSGNSSASKQKAFAFADESTRAAIYNIMLESQRAAAHTIIATYLEKQHAHSMTVELLKTITDHHLLGESTRKKIEFLLLSSQAAQKESHYYEAISFLNELIFVCSGLHVLDLITRSRECIAAAMKTVVPVEPEKLSKRVKPLLSQKFQLFNHKVAIDYRHQESTDRGTINQLVMRSEDSNQSCSSSGSFSSLYRSFTFQKHLHSVKATVASCPIVCSDDVTALGLSALDIAGWLTNVAILYFRMGDTTAFENYTFLSNFILETAPKTAATRKSEAQNEAFKRVCTTTLEGGRYSVKQKAATGYVIAADESKLLCFCAKPVVEDKQHWWRAALKLIAAKKVQSPLMAADMPNRREVKQGIARQLHCATEQLALAYLIRGKPYTSILLLEGALAEVTEWRNDTEGERASFNKGRYSSGGGRLSGYSRHPDQHLNAIENESAIFRLKCILATAYSVIEHPLREETRKECESLAIEHNDPTSVSVHKTCVGLEASLRGNLEVSIDAFHKAKNSYFSKGNGNMSGLHTEIVIAWLLVLTGKVDEARFLIVTVSQQLTQLERNNPSTQLQPTCLRKQLINLDLLCSVFSRKCWFTKADSKADRPQMYGIAQGALYDGNYDGSIESAAELPTFQSADRPPSANRVADILTVFEKAMCSTSTLQLGMSTATLPLLRSMIEFYLSRSPLKCPVSEDETHLAQLLSPTTACSPLTGESTEPREPLVITSVMEGTLFFMVLFSSQSFLLDNMICYGVCSENVSQQAFKEILALTYCSVSAFKKCVTANCTGLVALYWVLHIRLELLLQVLMEHQCPLVHLLFEWLGSQYRDMRSNAEKNQSWLCGCSGIGGMKEHCNNNVSSECTQRLSSLLLLIQRAEAEDQERLDLCDESSVVTSQCSQRSSQSSVSMSSKSSSSVRSSGSVDAAFKRFPFAQCMLRRAKDELQRAMYAGEIKRKNSG